MTTRLRHRGPDGDGIWSTPGAVLGHRRLSIQDLSESAHQPMLLGDWALTYNGELYNHAPLRQSLKGPWHSSGDTETLLHLLAERGIAGLSSVAGMFAFGLWNSRERTLLLARDRLGIKPLYYRLLPLGIAFASELKALVGTTAPGAAVESAPEIDRSAVRDFLFHGYIPAPKTIYKGIAKLPAGHSLRWCDGRVQVDRYWSPSTVLRPRSAAEATEELDAVLREVVPQHTLADVPVGVFLSGGIDSALTTSYLQTPRTYTLAFAANARSEAEGARAAAVHFNTIHTELMATAADFVHGLDAMPQLFDEPFGDSAAWSNYLVAQLARREVTVALSGEGGDEIFCGYPRYWSRIGERSTALNRALAAVLPPLSRFGASMQRHSYAGLPAYAAALGGMTARQIDHALSDQWRAPDYDYLWFYRQFWREDLEPLAQLRWLDLNTDLSEGLLTKVDRTSMAHSLEVRPPLLDHRLVELMLTVDPHLLVDASQHRGKLLARRLLEPRVPAGYLDRPKSGFGLPVHRWLKQQPELLRDAVDRLMARDVLKRPVSTEFRRAWYVLVLDRWFTAFD